MARGENLSDDRWSLGSRLAFRFCCTYALIEWATLGVLLHTSPLTVGLLSNPNWFGSLNITLGRWLIAHVLNLPEHSLSGMSANNLPLFLGMIAAGAISAVVALAWSGLDRRRAGHPDLFLWVHTGMRFVLAATMLLYGWAKVLPEQFDAGLDYMALEVAQHNPRDLLWAFMSGSREYQVFTGLIEVTGGLLLLTRRTAMLGAVISMAAMANVLVLDISYDVPVKFLAGQIFLMCLFVLAPFARRLLSAFDLSRSIQGSRARRLLRSASADRVVRAVGVAVGIWIALTTLQDNRDFIARNDLARQTNPLYGIWDLEAKSRNGATVPLLITDETLWRRLIVQSSAAAVIVPMMQSAPPPRWTGRGSPVRYTLRLDSVAHTIELTPFPFSATRERLAFAYALPDPDHLVLTSKSTDDTSITRLRRFDLSTYPLLNWERHWNW